MSGESKVYFTYGQLGDGRWCGVISQRQPQMGDKHVVALAVETANTAREIKEWGNLALMPYKTTTGD